MESIQEHSLLEYLVKVGAVKKIFNSNSNDFEFMMTSKCDKFMPEIPENFYHDFQEGIFILWHSDLINVSFDENNKQVITINDNSLDSEKIRDLSIESVVILRQVISAISKS